MTETAPTRPSALVASPRAAPPKPWLPGALVVLGFVATASGGIWLWQQQQDIAARIVPPPPPPPAVSPTRVAVLESEVNGLQQRLVQLEKRPAPVEISAPPVAAPPAAPRTDTPPANNAGVAQALAARVEALEQRLAQTEQALTVHTTRQALLLTAGTALDAGRPLGDIPGAPAALAKFAYVSPPTMASLRLSFDPAASAAEAASDPATAELSLAARAWQHVQTLLTLRQGDNVLIGTPAARVVEQARAKLEAGDLAGAVAALDELDPAAARAIAGWRAEAQSLLDARAALAELERS